MLRPSGDRAGVSPDAPSLNGVRFAVLGIGDRSYDNFCGYAKSLDTRLADLGATRILDRADCEVHDDQPVSHWSDSVVRLTAPAGAISVQEPESTAPAAPEPFTRARPISTRWRCRA